MNFFRELQKRNKILYWFGLFNFTIALVCLLMMPFENIKLLGVNRWLKPFKFYTSVGIAVITIGWLMYYLKNKKWLKTYSWIIVISMLFENGLIIMQAIRKTTSHFNITSGFNGIIFSLMGILIMIFTIVMVFICINFFRQKTFDISTAYLWGIRLGILLFIFFSLEGGVMVGLLKHTVGGPDGGPGLPAVNWSSVYGDLRIPHFFGIHSLQVLPLFGYYYSNSKKQTIFFAIIYFTIAMLLFAQAIAGIPLFF